MMKLENLTPGAVIQGILPGQYVTLVSVQWHGSDAVEVTYKDAQGQAGNELLASAAGSPIRLVIDATKVGQRYRLLTIGLAYKRRTLPLVWSVHRGSRGHTSLADQVALFAALRPFIPGGSEVWVLGDSEFQSVRLLQ